MTMSDLLHTHLTIGLMPPDECPACAQVLLDLSAPATATA